MTRRKSTTFTADATRLSPPLFLRREPGDEASPTSSTRAQVFTILCVTWTLALASFPGLPTVHRLQYAKTKVGRPGIFYHVNDVWYIRPSPSVFAYCKRSKTGQWEDLGTRLSHSTIYGLSVPVVVIEAM